MISKCDRHTIGSRRHTHKLTSQTANALEEFYTPSRLCIVLGCMDALVGQGQEKQMGSY